MTLSKQQATLYEAVSNIDSKYIEETITAPIRFTPGIVKRITAIAAMLAIILSVSFTFLNSTPVFAVRVSASGIGEQTLQVGDPPTSMMNIYDSGPPEHFLTDVWAHKAFAFKLCQESMAIPFVKHSTDIEIHYNGRILGRDHLVNSSLTDGLPRCYQDSNLAILLFEPANKRTEPYYSINGWLDATTDLSIHIYTVDDNIRTLAQTITVRVTVTDTSWTGYTLEVTEITMH